MAASLETSVGVRNEQVGTYLASLLEHVLSTLQKQTAGSTAGASSLEQVALPVLRESASKCPVEVFPASLGRSCEQIADILESEATLRRVLVPLLWVLARRATIADWRSLEALFQRWHKNRHETVVAPELETIWCNVLGHVQLERAASFRKQEDLRVWQLELATGALSSAEDVRSWLDRVYILAQTGCSDDALLILQQVMQRSPFHYIVEIEKPLWIVVQSLCDPGSSIPQGQSNEAPPDSQATRSRAPTASTISIECERSGPKRSKCSGWRETLNEYIDAAAAGEHWLLLAALLLLLRTCEGPDQTAVVAGRVLAASIDAERPAAARYGALFAAGRHAPFSARLAVAARAAQENASTADHTISAVSTAACIPWLVQPESADEHRQFGEFVAKLRQDPALAPHLARWLCITGTGAAYVDPERILDHLTFAAELIGSIRPRKMPPDVVDTLIHKTITLTEPSWPQMRLLALLLHTQERAAAQRMLLDERLAPFLARCISWAWRAPAAALSPDTACVMRVLATLIQHCCGDEHAPVVMVLVQELDQAMHASLGDWRFIHARGVLARNACSRLATVALAALIEQASTLERRRRRRSPQSVTVPAIDQISWELERTASPHHVSRLLSEQGPRLFPLLLHQLLHHEELADLLQSWLQLSDSDAVFTFVYRCSFAFLVSHIHERNLEALSARVSAAAAALGIEEQVQALADSLLLSNRVKRDKAFALLATYTGSTIHDIARTYTTRVILRLLTALDTRPEAVVRDALEELAILVDARDTVTLIAHDLLRILDALNRRIFRRQDHQAIRILNLLFKVIAPELHLFVPKVLATLKNALEIPDLRLHALVIQCWVTFLEQLGWERAAPHLGTAFAVLGPYLEGEPALAQVILDLTRACAASPAKSTYLDEIFLPPADSTSSVRPTNWADSVPLEAAHPAETCASAAAAATTTKTTTTPCPERELPTLSIPTGESSPDTHRPAPARTNEVLGAIRTLLNERKQQRQPAEQLIRLLPIATKHHSRLVRLLALRELTSVLRQYRNQLYVDIVLHQRTQLVSELLQEGLLLAVTDGDANCRDEALLALALLGAVDPARLSLEHRQPPPLSLPSLQQHAVVSQSSGSEGESLLDQVVIPTLLEQCLIPALRRVESAQAREWQNRIGFVIQEVLRLALSLEDTTDITSTEHPLPSSPSSSPKRPQTRSTEERIQQRAFWRALSEHMRQIIRPFLYSRYILRTVAQRKTSSETIGRENQGVAASLLPCTSSGTTVETGAPAATLLKHTNTEAHAAASSDAVPASMECTASPATSRAACARCAVAPGKSAAQWICGFAVHLVDVLDQVMCAVDLTFIHSDDMRMDSGFGPEASTVAAAGMEPAAPEAIPSTGSTGVTSATSSTGAVPESVSAAGTKQKPEAAAAIAPIGGPTPNATLSRKYRCWWGLFRACRTLTGHDQHTAIYLLPYLVQTMLQIASDLDSINMDTQLAISDLDVEPSATAPEALAALSAPRDASAQHQTTAAPDSLPLTGGHTHATAAAATKANRSKHWITRISAFLRSHLVAVLSSDLTEAIQLVFLLLDRLAEQRDHDWMSRVRGLDPCALATCEYAALAAAAAQQPEHICPFNALERALPAALLARAALTSGALHRALLYLDQCTGSCSESQRRVLQRLYRELGDLDAMQAITTRRAPVVVASGGRTPDASPSLLPGTAANGYEQGLSSPSSSSAFVDWESFTLDAEAYHATEEALIGYERGLRAFPTDLAAMRGYLQSLMTLGLWETMLHPILTHPERSAVADLGIEAALRLGRWDALETLSASVEDPAARGTRSALANVAKALHQAQQPGHESGAQLSETLRRARSALSDTVATAALESYARTYPALVQLHAVADVECILGDHADLEAVLQRYAHDWFASGADVGAANWLEARLQCVASSWQAREPILAIQRAALLVQVERARHLVARNESAAAAAAAAPCTSLRVPWTLAGGERANGSSWAAPKNDNDTSSSTSSGGGGGGIERPAPATVLAAGRSQPASVQFPDQTWLVSASTKPAVLVPGTTRPPASFVTPERSAQQFLERALVFQEAADAVTLRLARLARKSGHHAAAIAYLQQLPRASLFQGPACIELAKIYRARGETRRALAQLPLSLTALQLGRKTASTSNSSSTGTWRSSSGSAARLVSKALCLQAQWMQEDRSAQPQEIIDCFQRALSIQPETEKIYVLLGRFYDSLTPERDAEPRIQARQQWLYRQSALEHYARSLRYGCRYVYHSLPRIITLWLDEDSEPVLEEHTNDSSSNSSSSSDKRMTPDTASHIERSKVLCAIRTNTRALDSSNNNNNNSSSSSCSISRPDIDSYEARDSPSIARRSAAEYLLPIVRRLRTRLPLYIWFVVLPQLLSRVTAHHSAAVRAELCSLLADCVVAYPGQAVWYVVPLAGALDANRAATARAILDQARQRGDLGLSTLLDAGLELCAQLARVCTQVPPRGLKQMTASVHLRALRRLLRERLQGLAIPVPYQAYLRLFLPTSGRFRDDLHEGFAVSVPTLVDVDEPVWVMNSLMRPKRIGLLASDGHVYPFLCKREDAGDMRKDARMMDLLNVVNRLLAKTADAQQRRLVLRTYAVLPLNEECGILEWMPHLVPLRAAVAMLHRALGYEKTATSSTEEIRLAYERHAKARPEPDQVRWYTEWLLPRFPPVLRHFYSIHFGRRHSPAAWFAARQAFARSCALWSMVGYVVGLGDRHGENVLLDTRSGECVHVDFACLFDQGLRLKVPETVPFRLTPNMIDAMGTAGYQGVFYRSAQIALSVLRNHRETLLSVLETFLHDPLLDWAAAARDARTAAAMEASATRGPVLLPGPAAAMRLPREPADTARLRRPADKHGKAAHPGNDMPPRQQRQQCCERNAQALEMLRVVDRKCRGLHGAQSGTPLSVEGDVARLVAEATSARNLARMYIWWLPHV